MVQYCFIDKKIEKEEKKRSMCFPICYDKGDFSEELLDFDMIFKQSIKVLKSLKTEEMEKLIQDPFYLQNIVEILLPSSLLLSIEEKIIITEEAKNALQNDNDMIFVMRNVLENLSNFHNDKINLLKIDIGHDPEDPEWKPYEIYIEFNIDDFNERMEMRHKLIDIAFKDLDEEKTDNVFITDV